MYAFQTRFRFQFNVNLNIAWKIIYVLKNDIRYKKGVQSMLFYQTGANTFEQKCEYKIWVILMKRLKHHDRKSHERNTYYIYIYG